MKMTPQVLLLMVIGTLSAFLFVTDVHAQSSQWINQFGSALDDAAVDVAVDSAGVYVAGETEGAFPGQSFEGGDDAFVQKYDLEGNALWTSQLGTAADDTAVGVAVDDSGVYVVGETEGALLGQSLEGEKDAFVVKLSP